MTVALVAVTLTQTSGRGASAAASPVRMPTVEETIAGFLSVADHYPGGLPALLDLFDTGECAGAESYEDASPECQALIDEIVAAGIAHPTPLPTLSTEPTTATTELPTETSTPTSTTPPTSTQPTSTLPTTTQPTSTLPTTTPTTTEPTTTQPTSTLPTTTEPTTTQPTSTLPTTTEPTTTQPTSTLPTTTEPTTTQPTSTLPTTTEPTTTQPTSTLPTTTTPMTTTPPTTTMPPLPQPGPLLVAVGDSVTSGHESRSVRQQDGVVVWKTTCDDPATSWAEDLRALLGVPVARYFNYAHSGAKTSDVLNTSPYTNPCGRASQQARTQIADAIAVLRNNPSQPGAANVAVATAGVNDTNWVNVAKSLVTRKVVGFGGAPEWAVDNQQACTDYVLGNKKGNKTKGAPVGEIQAAWDGEKNSGPLAAGVARIALGLITADPGAQVRYLLYYKWFNDPYIPAVCTQAAQQATGKINGWIQLGVATAQLMWAMAGGNANRISAVCEQVWALGAQMIQTQLESSAVDNPKLNVPGWPHPNVAGRADLAVCVNGKLPRAQGGGVA